jgi:EmrB/QacA subfamily drug resistance transporter
MPIPETDSSGSAVSGQPRLGWSLALLAMGQLIFSLDLNIVWIALPDISKGLGFSDQTQQWVVSAYLVFAGGFLLLGGRAADLLGRRRVFVLALSVYAAASLVGGLAGSPGVIIAARAVQGFGGALLLPSTLSLINTLFAEGPKRNRALAVWSGAGASGLTIGALAGGVLTEAFGWRSVFFVNVPLAGIVAAAALVVIPRDPARTDRRRFDLPGALTVTGGASLLVFALVQGPEVGWTDPAVIVAEVAAVLLLIAFAVVESRSSDPLMPPRLFRNRSLIAGMGMTFLYMASFGTLPYFLTVLLQTVHGFSALGTGLAFVVPAVSVAAGTQLGERLATRFGTRTTLLGGAVVGVAGMVALAPGFGLHSSYLVAVPGLVVSSLGQGVTWTAMWIAAASGVDAEQQGVASGMASTTLNLGNAIGLAALVVIANHGIGHKHGVALRTALAHGSRLAVLVAAAVMLVGTVLTLAFARRAPAGSDVLEGAPHEAAGTPGTTTQQAATR